MFGSSDTSAAERRREGAWGAEYSDSSSGGDRPDLDITKADGILDRSADGPRSDSDPVGGRMTLFALNFFLRRQIQKSSAAKIAIPTTGPITAPTIQIFEGGDPELLFKAVPVAEDDTVCDEELATYTIY